MIESWDFYQPNWFLWTDSYISIYKFSFHSVKIFVSQNQIFWLHNIFDNWKNCSDSAVSYKTLRYQWQRRIKLSCVNDIAESDYTVSGFNDIAESVWFVYHKNPINFEFDRKHCVTDTAVRNKTFSLTPRCPWHCWAWLRVVHDIVELDSALSVTLQSIYFTCEYILEPKVSKLYVKIPPQTTRWVRN